MLDAVQKQDIASKTGNISDDEMLTVLARMIKQREESAATYESGGRPELAQAERDEIVVIREFMPKQMSADESREAVTAAIAATGAASIKDMGKVMAALKERHTGQMDFGKASGAGQRAAGTPKILGRLTERHTHKFRLSESLDSRALSCFVVRMSRNGRFLMRYGEGLLEEILRRTDLVQLVGRRVKLNRKGRVFWGLCPFHKEKSPSFKVENERRNYHCFGCGAGGDAFKWLQETEGLSFPEAVQKLGRRSGRRAARLDAGRRSAREPSKNRSTKSSSSRANSSRTNWHGRAGDEARRYLQGPRARAERRRSAIAWAMRPTATRR